MFISKAILVYVVSFIFLLLITRDGYGSFFGMFIFGTLILFFAEGVLADSSLPNPRPDYRDYWENPEPRFSRRESSEDVPWSDTSRRRDVKATQRHPERKRKATQVVVPPVYGPVFYHSSPLLSEEYCEACAYNTPHTCTIGRKRVRRG